MEKLIEGLNILVSKWKKEGAKHHFDECDVAYDAGLVEAGIYNNCVEDLEDLLKELKLGDEK